MPIFPCSIALPCVNCTLHIAWIYMGVNCGTLTVIMLTKCMLLGEKLWENYSDYLAELITILFVELLRTLKWNLTGAWQNLFTVCWIVRTWLWLDWLVYFYSVIHPYLQKIIDIWCISMTFLYLYGTESCHWLLVILYVRKNFL